MYLISVSGNYQQFDWSFYGKNELRKKNIPYELKTVNSGVQNRTVGIFLGRLGQLHNDADIMYYIYSKPEYISEIKSIANDCLNKFR